MYNTKVICTYNTPEVFLDTDVLSDKDKDFIRDAIYRQELLNILGIDDFNENEMAKAIHNLYEKIKNCSFLKECMVNISERFQNKDFELGLMILFSYDYMYLTHMCVSEYLEKGEITEKNRINLKLKL
jgi:hypothetical protein